MEAEHEDTRGVNSKKPLVGRGAAEKEQKKQDWGTWEDGEPQNNVTWWHLANYMAILKICIKRGCQVRVCIKGFSCHPLGLGWPQVPGLMLEAAF